MVCFDAVPDAENDVGNPPKPPKQPEERKDKDESGRGTIQSVPSRSAAKNSGEDRKKENNHSAKKECHVTELPDKGL